MSEETFSRTEASSIIFSTAERLYAAHVHAGRPYLSLAEAVEMAAMAFGLAQSEVAHQMAESARTAPNGVAKSLAASWSALSQKIAEEQDARATRVIGAMHVKRES